MPEKIEYFQISAATYAIATIFCVLRRGVTTSVSVLGTDLALEAAQMQAKSARLTSRPGLEVRRRERGGYALTAMDLTDPHRAAELQRPVGKYITMELGPSCTGSGTFSPGAPGASPGSWRRCCRRGRDRPWWWAWATAP